MPNPKINTSSAHVRLPNRRPSRSASVRQFAFFNSQFSTYNLRPLFRPRCLHSRFSTIRGYRKTRKISAARRNHCVSAPLREISPIIRRASKQHNGTQKLEIPTLADQLNRPPTCTVGQVTIRSEIGKTPPALTNSIPIAATAPLVVTAETAYTFVAF
jgi:hypothetical protein